MIRNTESEKESAILTVIAIISHNDFFMSSNASYKGGNSFTSSLADVKLSCVGRQPFEPNLSDDFACAVSNISWLMDRVHTIGLPRLGVTMPPGSPTPTSLKFQHVLFKVSCLHFI
jgi:hypothetical protein